MVFHFCTYKLKSPSPKDALWHGLLEFCIFTISSLSPLEKGQGLLYDQTWIPFSQGCFVPNLVEIGPVVLGKVFLNFIKCNFAFYIPRKRSSYQRRQRTISIRKAKNEIVKIEDIQIVLIFVNINLVVLLSKIRSTDCVDLFEFVL